MKKCFFLFVSIFSLAFSTVSAQQQVQPEAPKQTSGGVVNGKALTLAQPAYPPAARAVHAGGAVNVQVTIDEEGNVASASAVSGHPLLRQAAEQAALASKFRPTQLGGQPIKVTGVIVYNFVGEAVAANWFKIGYDLANVQNSMTVKFLNTESLGKNFPAEWTAENEQLKRLAQIKQTAVESQPEAPIVLTEKEKSQISELKTEDGTVRKVIVRRVAKPDDRSTGEQNAIVQSLIASLQGRLATDELNSWQFNLGLTLSEAWTKVGNPMERERVLSSLRSQFQSAPESVPADYLDSARQIVELLEKPNVAHEDRRQIMEIMPRLFKNQ